MSKIFCLHLTLLWNSLKCHVKNEQDLLLAFNIVVIFLKMLCKNNQGS
jgi:hypothetical protein